MSQAFSGYMGFVSSQAVFPLSRFMFDDSN